MEVFDERRVRLRRIAGPDPDPVVLLYDRISAHPGRWRDAFLARDAHAFAARIELQAVIRALHDVGDELAHRQLRLAMAATVFQRDRLAVERAKQQHRLLQNDPAAHVAADLVIPGGDVPGVADEHAASFVACLRTIIKSAPWQASSCRSTA